MVWLLSMMWSTLVPLSKSKSMSNAARKTQRRAILSSRITTREFWSKRAAQPISLQTISTKIYEPISPLEAQKVNTPESSSTWLRDLNKRAFLWSREEQVTKFSLRLSVIRSLEIRRTELFCFIPMAQLETTSSRQTTGTVSIFCHKQMQKFSGTKS